MLFTFPPMYLVLIAAYLTEHCPGGISSKDTLEVAVDAEDFDSLFQLVLHKKKNWTAKQKKLSVRYTKKVALVH